MAQGQAAPWLLSYRSDAASHRHLQILRRSGRARRSQPARQAGHARGPRGTQRRRQDHPTASHRRRDVARRGRDQCAQRPAHRLPASGDRGDRPPRGHRRGAGFASGCPFGGASHGRTGRAAQPCLRRRERRPRPRGAADAGRPTAGAAGVDPDELLRELGAIQTAFESAHGYELETRAQTILRGMGFRERRLRPAYRRALRGLADAGRPGSSSPGAARPPPHG